MMSATERSGWEVLDAYISDYDRDGTDEIFLLRRHSIAGYYLAAFDPFQAVDEWSVAVEYVNTVSGVDLNGDGYQDILTNGAAYDVFNDSVIWEPELGESILAAEAGDFDGDGRVEIVAATDPYGLHPKLIIYSRPNGEATFVQRAVQMYEAASFYDLVVSDTDGNGESEVLLLTSERFDTIVCDGIESSHCDSIRRFDSNLELLNSFLLPRGDKPVRLFVLPAAAGRKHLMVADGSRITAYDAATGGKIWQSPGLIGSISPNSLHYFDDGGEARLVIGTSHAMYVTR